MKTARKIIERLIGEYTIESMSGEEVRVSNMPENDEDLNVALMQKQYGTWCLQSKKFLIIYRIPKTKMLWLCIISMKATTLMYYIKK